MVEGGGGVSRGGDWDHLFLWGGGQCYYMMLNEFMGSSVEVSQLVVRASLGWRVMLTPNIPSSLPPVTVKQD